MHALGYLLFAVEVIALAVLSQLWVGIRVQRFTRHFAIEPGDADRASSAPPLASAPAHRLAA